MRTILVLCLLTSLAASAQTFDTIITDMSEGNVARATFMVGGMRECKGCTLLVVNCSTGKGELIVDSQTYGGERRSGEFPIVCSRLSSRSYRIAPFKTNVTMKGVDKNGKIASVARTLDVKSANFESSGKGSTFQYVGEAVFTY